MENLPPMAEFATILVSPGLVMRRRIGRRRVLRDDGDCVQASIRLISVSQFPVPTSGGRWGWKGAGACGQISKKKSVVLRAWRFPAELEGFERPSLPEDTVASSLVSAPRTSGNIRRARCTRPARESRPAPVQARKETPDVRFQRYPAVFLHALFILLGLSFTTFSD